MNFYPAKEEFENELKSFIVEHCICDLQYDFISTNDQYRVGCPVHTTELSFERIQ